METDRPSAEVLARIHARLGNPGSFEESERRRLRGLERHRKKRERFLANPTAVAIEGIARPFRQDKTGFIYFVECVGYVKIGFTTSVPSRLGAIQSHNPLDLRLLGFLRGPIQVEGRVQEACEKFHHRGEWFRGSEELLEAISMTSVKVEKLWEPGSGYSEETERWAEQKLAEWVR